MNPHLRWRAHKVKILEEDVLITITIEVAMNIDYETLKLSVNSKFLKRYYFHPLLVATKEVDVIV